MKQRQKKAVSNSVDASTNRLNREGAQQDPISFSILEHTQKNGKPTVTITTQWREAEPNLQLTKLFRLLLLRKNK